MGLASLSPSARTLPRHQSATADGWHLAFAALIGFAVAALSPALLNDGDTGWHLAAGRWIVENRAIPATDPFSWTMPGARWTAHEWLSEVLMFGAWSLGGWAGLAMLFGGTAAVIMVMLTRLSRRHLAYPAALLPPLACAAALMPFIFARPHIFGWAMLIGWVLVLMRARDRNAAPNWHWAALMIVWANLHGSFVLGLALIGPFAAEALWAGRAQWRAVVMRWSLFGIASLGAALMTPHGIEGLTFPLYVSNMAILPLIEEWQATDFTQPGTFQLLTLTLVALLLWSRPRVSVFRALVLIGLFAMAVAHVRHQAVFAIIAMLFLTGPIATRLASPPAPAIATPRIVMLGAAAALLMIGTLGLRTHANPPESANVPSAAIAAIPTDLRGQPVLNSYSFGGPLSFAGIPVFIDGRADLYGDAFVTDFAAMVLKGDRQAFDAGQADYRFTWTILDPTEPLVNRLDTDPEWRRIYADEHAVIHRHISSLGFGSPRP
jgi:hypothetical protein